MLSPVFRPLCTKHSARPSKMPPMSTILPCRKVLGISKPKSQTMFWKSYVFRWNKCWIPYHKIFNTFYERVELHLVQESCGHPTGEGKEKIRSYEGTAAQSCHSKLFPKLFCKQLLKFLWERMRISMSKVSRKIYPTTKQASGKEKCTNFIGIN